MRNGFHVGAAAAVCLLLISHTSIVPAQRATFKVAYWNVKSGKGQIALAGHPTTFADTSNCTDTTRPLNGWGVNFVQQELINRIKNDPAIVALGLGESWTSVCGSPENIRATLGWPARTGENNGVAIVARYGFAGPAVWQQLDTSLTSSPSDTMWVVRTPVCLDAACASAMSVFTAHWGGDSLPENDVQAQQTAAFLSKMPAGEPHLLIGDLNVFEGPTMVCTQPPQNTALNALRNAGYLDTWLTVNGSAEGFTGMANRAGCGVPEGYAWKRIDYAWYKNLTPISMTRFGMKTPGDESPSDHYGIIAEYARPISTPDVTPPTSAITSPAPNAVVAGQVSVAINASDDRAVARVDLLVDDVVVGSDSSAPYAIAWNTTAVVNGVHRLLARAHDLAGNTADSPAVVVTVNNTSTSVILVNDHFDTLNRTVWIAGPFTSSADTTIPVAVVNGHLDIGPLKASTTSTHYNGISTGTYNLSGGGHATVQLVQSTTPTTPAFAMFAAGSDGNNFYRMYESAGSVVAEKKIAGMKTTLATAPYSPAAIQYMRIRRDAALQQVIYEIAPASGVYQVLHHEAWDSRVAAASMRFELKAGTSAAIAAPGHAIWDNFRIVVR